MLELLRLPTLYASILSMLRASRIPQEVGVAICISMWLQLQPRQFG